MKKSPKVSVITPIYNTEEFLEQCIESVLSQTYKDWELILVDDGSTDNSLEIGRRYADEYPQISHYQSNSGCVSSARNSGMRYAKGEYLYFVDSDDFMLPDALSILVKAAETHPDLNFIQGSFRVLNMKTGADVKASRFEQMAKYNGQPMSGEEYLSTMGLTITYPWNSLINKNFLLRNHISFPDEIKMQEDLVFVVDILLTPDCRAMYVDNEGVQYRFGRSESLTNIKPRRGAIYNNKVKSLGRSLLLSAKWMAGVKTDNKTISSMLNQRLLDNLTGFLYSAKQLLPDRELIEMMKLELPHIPVKGFGMKQVLARIYNISPRLAVNLRRFL